jgi:hypothetical protein
VPIGEISSVFSKCIPLPDSPQLLIKSIMSTSMDFRMGSYYSLDPSNEDRIVNELIHKFTHNIEMPWIFPGIPPTGKRVEVAVIVVVQFKDGKVAGERIYWDQASVFAQIGLIDESRLPVTGAEASRKDLDPAKDPSNKLIERANQ